jgi:penicillin amidase
MATTTTPAVEIQKAHHSRRVAWIVLLVLLLTVLSTMSWLYFIVHSALPQLDGFIKVPGLAAPVHVIRDNHGVPTIEAANPGDLYFAQGYVIAQDRLWQMDSMRRFAAGELAEVLGDSLVQHDKEQRILGLRVAARRALEVISPQERSYFEAYGRGITVYMESHHNRLPLEFRILRYSPRPWTAEDSMLISAQMIKELNHYPYKDALAREKILAKLGSELTADLFVNTSWHDRPPTVSRPTLENQEKGNDDGEPIQTEKGSSITQRTIPSFSDFGSRMALGSNNWVVSGTHTVTGRPLLANDPHLGHQMPNLWYEVHLRSGKLDVAGVALPGMPAVILGHNQRIAWGFTNVGPTAEDLYIETFNNDGQYLTQQGWKQPEHRKEIIHVKGKPDLAVDVVVTRHGPIITEVIKGETRKLALRWTAYDGARSPFFDLDSAQNWQEFRAALSKFDAPGQNAVYADIDGNIGFQATGRIPIRASGDGSLPENGADDAHEWTGYVPFEKLPSIFNPASGIIATANGRITPDNYPYSISTGWEAPWRTARIYRVLESGKKFSAADMLDLQSDIYSEFERYSAERFVYAVDHAKRPSARSKQAAEIMRNWDGRMSADSAAPVIASRARYQLMRLLLEPKLGPAPKDSGSNDGVLSWKTYNWGMESVWLENLLLHQPKRWLPEKFSNYDELLTAAVEDAVTGNDAPKDLSGWKWGEYHPLEIQHPIFGQIPLLRGWTAPGLQPQSGSGFTVKAVTKHAGPSERMTVDFADLDRSTLNTVTGQSGNLLSPHYMDQWKAWYEGSTFSFPFSQQAVENARVHELKLQP